MVDTQVFNNTRDLTVDGDNTETYESNNVIVISGSKTQIVTGASTEVLHDTRTLSVSGDNTETYEQNRNITVGGDLQCISFRREPFNYRWKSN